MELLAKAYVYDSLSKGSGEQSCLSWCNYPAASVAAVLAHGAGVGPPRGLLDTFHTLSWKAFYRFPRIPKEPRWKVLRTEQREALHVLSGGHLTTRSKKYHVPAVECSPPASFDFFAPPVNTLLRLTRDRPGRPASPARNKGCGSQWLTDRPKLWWYMLLASRKQGKFINLGYLNSDS